MKNFLSAIIIMLAMFSVNETFSQTVSDTVKVTPFKVSGITCNGDMPLIKKKLINEEGIDEVTYSEAKSGSVTFTITFHPSIITDQKIRTLIEASPSCDNPNVFPYKTKAATTKKGNR